jgi:hypothetical protein
LIVLLAGIQAVRSQDPLVYLTQAEFEGLLWISSHTHQDDLVLSSPETGLYIPAHTGRQVLYGHPFETVGADKAKKNVLEFFSGNFAETELQNFLVNQGVDYIFYGPREQNLGNFKSPISWDIGFQSADVTIFTLK